MLTTEFDKPDDDVGRVTDCAFIAFSRLRAVFFFRVLAYSSDRFSETGKLIIDFY